MLVRLRCGKILDEQARQADQQQAKNGEQQALRKADDGWRMANGKRKGVEGLPADYSLGRLGCKNDRQTVADGQRATGNGQRWSAVVCRGVEGGCVRLR
jgi:surface antigen